MFQVTTVVLNDECVPVDVWAAKKLEDCDFWFLSKNNGLRNYINFLLSTTACDLYFQER